MLCGCSGPYALGGEPFERPRASNWCEASQQPDPAHITWMRHGLARGERREPAVRVGRIRRCARRRDLAPEPERFGPVSNSSSVRSRATEALLPRIQGMRKGVTPMTCEDAIAILGEFLDHALPAGVGEALEAHLS